jgi:hypothetical protein
MNRVVAIEALAHQPLDRAARGQLVAHRHLVLDDHVHDRVRHHVRQLDSSPPMTRLCQHDPLVLAELLSSVGSGATSGS